MYCYFVSHTVTQSVNSLYKQYNTVTVQLFRLTHCYTVSIIHCTNSTVLLLYSFFVSLTVTLSVQFTVQTVQYCNCTSFSSHSLLHCQYNSLYKQYNTLTVQLFHLTHCYTVSTIHCTNSTVLLLYSYFISLTVTL